MNSCYIHSFFVSFSVSIPFFLFIFFFSKTFTFFSTLFTTLSIYRYGKAYLFPIYERNVPCRVLHERNKTEKYVGRHAVELRLVYARYEILTTTFLRLRSWEVKPRQLVNSYKGVRRIVLP